MIARRLGMFGPLLLPLLAFGQTPSGPERALSLLAPARAALQEALGEPVPEGPRFRCADLTELRQTADPELEAILRFGSSGDSSLDGLARGRRQALETLWHFLAAYHPPGSDSILLPTSDGELARWVQSQAPAGVESAAFLQDFARLALVHEVVRLVLDRRYDLANRFGRCRNAEETQALEALAEGRALGITRQVARQLGAENALPLLTERFRQFTPKGMAPNRELIEQRYRACAWGLAFFDFAEAQRVPDAERRVFAHVPAQLSLVRRPELYWQVEASLRPGLEGRLARQAKTLPHWQWDWAPQPWTPAMVREVAELFGAKERAEKCLTAWREGGCLVWRDKRNPRVEVAVGAVQFADAAAARAYYGLSVDLQREQDNLLNATPGAPQRVVWSRSESVTIAGAEEAVRTEKRFQPVGGTEPPIAVTTLLLRAGERVVLFTWRDGPADPDWASRLLAGLGGDAPRP